MKKLIAFDLDGTITQYRTIIDQKNKDVLFELSKKYHLVMVSAGDCKRIYHQIDNFPINIIGNYGMEESTIINGEYKLIRKDLIKNDELYFITTTNKIREKYGYTAYKGDSVEFHSSGMVTLHLLGTKADIKEKLVFDPTREKRKAMYNELVELFNNYSVYIGGTASIDFTMKKYNKFEAIMNYAKKYHINKDDILFVGDDFSLGGGDSHIPLNGLDYISVDNYKHLKELLQEYL